MALDPNFPLRAYERLFPQNNKELSPEEQDLHDRLWKAIPKCDVAGCNGERPVIFIGQIPKHYDSRWTKAPSSYMPKGNVTDLAEDNYKQMVKRHEEYARQDDEDHGYRLKAGHRMDSHTEEEGENSYDSEMSMPKPEELNQLIKDVLKFESKNSPSLGRQFK